jgi:hypothetical protein
MRQRQGNHETAAQVRRVPLNEFLETLNKAVAIAESDNGANVQGSD